VRSPLAGWTLDLRVAWRFLLKRPTSSAAAVLTLGAAVAVCAIAVGLVDQAFWRPVRGAGGRPLVTIYNARPAAPHFQVLSYPDYVALRDQLAGRVELAAFLRVPATVDGGVAPPARLTGEVVSGNYFAVQGAAPAAGRLLDDGTGRDGVVISHRLWQSRFGGRPDIAGQPLSVGRDRYTIVGVAAPRFRDPAYAADFWLPVDASRRVLRQDLLSRPEVPLFQTIGGLAPGTTLAQVQARVDLIETFGTPDGWRLAVLPGSALRFWPAYRDAIARFLRIFVALGAGILLVACANLAGLLLARGSERSRELALRQALGASRLDLLRRLFAESALLAAGGGLAGLLLAWWGTGALAQVPLPVPAPLALHFDLRTALIATAVTLAASLVFGTLSAWRVLRHALRHVLAASGAAGPAALPAARALVVTQVATCTVLVAVCGLLARSALRIAAVDEGFSPDQLVLGQVGPDDPDLDPAATLRFYERLTATLEARPDVDAVALGWHVPLTPVRVTRTYSVEPATPFQARQNVVGPGYFETLGIPLAGGREFSGSDTADGEPVAIVNVTLAARFAAGQAVGQLLHEGSRTFRIVGVVRDIAYNALTEPSQPFVYLPLAQAVRPDMYVHVRTRGPADGDLIRTAARLVDPRVAVSGTATMTEIRREAEAVPRTSALVSLGAAAMAVLLAAIGLYGVLATSVERRRRELAIRAALGATPGDVLAGVARDGLRLTVAGLGLGCIASFWGARLVSDLLYGIGRHDPLVFGLAPALVFLVSALAWIAPARRASRVDPAAALRGE
jgi:predicted permease